MARILVVEDNEMNRDMLCRRLRRRGYATLTAVNGRDAVAAARSERPDLILMDLDLPVVDGWDATRQIKGDARTAAIPLVVLTAHALVGDRARALAAGCDEYETKPVDLARLLEKIGRLLPEEQP